MDTKYKLGHKRNLLYNEIMDEKGDKRDSLGRFTEGYEGGPGRPKDTPEIKIAKKATKQLIEEYKEALGESLELIKPVLIEKAVKGDVQAIKEIHDRVMDKAKQPTDLKLSGDITVNVVKYGASETE